MKTQKLENYLKDYLCRMQQSQEQKKALIEYLHQFISEPRRLRFDEVIAQRMNHLQIVLEDTYQAHNASAVLRSCDCFGIQYVHFIENRNRYRVSADVDMGSSNWLSIRRYSDKTQNNTINCLKNLKEQGFRIVATTPHKNDYDLTSLPIDQKTALVFGTEIDGISQDVVDLADDFVKIPMFGFTESFNISVCAALCMYELSTRIRKSEVPYLLGEEERTNIYLDWLKTSINRSDLIIENYLQNLNK